MGTAYQFGFSFYSKAQEEIFFYGNDTNHWAPAVLVFIATTVACISYPLGDGVWSAVLVEL